MKEERCVKCAGKHWSFNCNIKEKNGGKIKCANCEEAHLASYRGCVVAKELQKRRDIRIRRQLKNRGRSLTVPNPGM